MTEKQTAAEAQAEADRVARQKAADKAKADAADPKNDRRSAEAKAQSDEDQATRAAVKQAEKEEAERVEAAKAPQEYPRYVHQIGQPSVLVHSKAEAQRLGSGWSETPTAAPEPVKPVQLSAQRLAEIQAEADAKVAAEEKAHQDFLKKGQ